MHLPRLNSCFSRCWFSAAVTAVSVDVSVDVSLDMSILSSDAASSTIPSPKPCGGSAGTPSNGDVCPPVGFPGSLPMKAAFGEAVDEMSKPEEPELGACIELLMVSILGRQFGLSMYGYNALVRDEEVVIHCGSSRDGGL